jgi:hypothetical protein
MAAGIAVLWLVVRYFDKFRGFVRFVLSFITVVTVAGLGTLAYSVNKAALFMVFFAFLSATVLSAMTIAGLIIGLCLYVLNLPFILLGFANPFFRERFCACLFTKSTPRNAAQPDTSQPYREGSESGSSVS